MTGLTVLLRFVVSALRLAVNALGQRKLRSALTMLGIMIGPMVMIALGGVVGGYSSYIISQITSLGQNNVMITPSAGYLLTEEDLDFLRSLPYVERAEPFYLTQALIRKGTKELSVYVYFVDVEFVLQSVGGIKVREGTFPSEGDTLGALVGYNVAYEKGEVVYEVGDVISIRYYQRGMDKKMQIKTANVVVRGIIDEYGGALFFSPDNTIFMQLEAGSRLFGLKEWSGILVRVTDPVYVRDLVETLRDTYGDRVSVISFAAIADMVSSVTAAVNYVNYIATLSAMAVAVAGTTATMVTSVVERTREIGVMKAVGYTNMHVVTLVMLESLLMSVIAASLGLTLGTFGALYLSGEGMALRTGEETITLKAEPLLTPSLYLKAFVLTVMVGVIGGVLPSYMASRIPPAVALRYE